MLQLSRPLPQDIPACVPGHRPNLVENRGAPAGHRLGTPFPSQWHIECQQCGVATVPTHSRAIAELRWRGDPQTCRIPLSDLGRVRERLAVAVANAACAA